MRGQTFHVTVGQDPMKDYDPSFSAWLTELVGSQFGRSWRENRPAPGNDLGNMAYFLYVDNFFARVEKTCMVAFANVFMWAGAAVGEISLTLFGVRPYEWITGRDLLRGLYGYNLFQAGQYAFNPVYGHIWGHESEPLTLQQRREEELKRQDEINDLKSGMYDPENRTNAVGNTMGWW
jgi:hypothetical protein